MAGAGAGGLACARALGALGLRVLVLDRQRTPASIAKGEILQPETVRILDSWGLLDALRATGARPVGRLAIRDPAGEPLLCLDYAGLPGAYRQILCADYGDLRRVLTDRLPPAARIRWGARVTGVLRDSDGRIGGVRFVADGAEQEIHAPLVVAADGMSSPLRRGAGIAVRRQEYPHGLVAFDVAGADVAEEVSAYRTGRGLCLVYPLPGGRCRLYAQVTPDEFRGRVDLGALRPAARRRAGDPPAGRGAAREPGPAPTARGLPAAQRAPGRAGARARRRGRPRGAPDGGAGRQQLPR
ncbi:hypothetical protein MCBG_00279 [Micromonospora sp. M42]|nr:hypothetical protein MCBG_00279 [Micromonospora sp. M42]